VQRLAVALSAAALVVALLGTTSLGTAAEKTVEKGVSALRGGKAEKASARGPRGPRGRRGPRGPRGYRGFLGAPGEKGERGDPGPSEAHETRSTTPVVITGDSESNETVVLTSSALPAGVYGVTAQVTLAGTGYGRVTCQARGPGASGPRLGVPARLHVGTGIDSVRDGTMTLAFGARLDAGGTLHLACWEPGSSNNPSATASSLVAVKSGNLTQTGS
jgi:hypothetical protein